MKHLVPVLVVVALLAAGFWLYQQSARNRVDPQLEEFHRDADLLIKGLQEYRKFVGNYPSGSPVELANALSGRGQTDKKFLLVTDRKEKKNNKGELVDPWGTPLQFYFAHNGVMIRSAGPNKAFEDSTVASSDDLYRTETK
jgi:hypothetical protein